MEILRKDFTWEILWQTLKLKQASLKECIEFQFELQQEWFKLELWIYEFLNSHWIVLKLEDLLKIDLNKFTQTLFDTRFKWFFGKRKVSNDSMPLEAYIMLLSEKFNRDPDYIIEKYTPEQLTYYTDWIIYNANEQTPEWRRKNKINLKMKEIKKEDKNKDLEEIKALELKLKNNGRN